MEKMTKYRQLLRRILEGHTSVSANFPSEGVERLLIMDEERGHYILMRLGWQDQKRIKWMTVFARIKEGKIWIEHDLTEEGIATELLEAGVPKENIVLAFHAPEMRQYTEFAAA